MEMKNVIENESSSKWMLKGAIKKERKRRREGEREIDRERKRECERMEISRRKKREDLHFIS